MASCLSRSARMTAKAAAVSFAATVSGSFVQGVPEPQRRRAQPLILYTKWRESFSTRSGEIHSLHPL